PRWTTPDGQRSQARPVAAAVQQFRARAARRRPAPGARSGPPNPMEDSRLSAVDRHPAPAGDRRSPRPASSTLTVVAPVYNEVEGIAHFARTALQVMDALGYPYTLLLVDDGSTDGTGAALDALHAEHPDRIGVVSFSRNFGHQAALTAGMDYA